MPLLAAADRGDHVDARALVDRGVEASATLVDVDVDVRAKPRPGIWAAKITSTVTTTTATDAPMAIRRRLRAWRIASVRADGRRVTGRTGFVFEGRGGTFDFIEGAGFGLGMWWPISWSSRAGSMDCDPNTRYARGGAASGRRAELGWVVPARGDRSCRLRGEMKEDLDQWWNGKGQARP